MTETGNAPATYGGRPSIRAGRWFTPISNIESSTSLTIAHSTIRFHPDCPFGEGRHPAMVCLVRGIVSNKAQAIHRTALSPDGTAIKRSGKTFRMSLGPITGGAVKIDSDDCVTMGVCIGEGLETCLAGRQMGLRPVWCAISTAGIVKFPILPGLEGLHIFRENDAILASPKAGPN